MLSAAKYIAEEDRLPNPTEAGVDYKAPEELPEDQESPPAVLMDSKHLVTFEGAAYACSLRDLTKIIHYIFDLLVCKLTLPNARLAVFRSEGCR